MANSAYTPCLLAGRIYLVAVHICFYRHPDLEESLLCYFGDDTTPAHLKMADTPGDDTTRLIPVMADNGTVSPFSLVAVRNVFVLPGQFGIRGPPRVSVAACLT